MFGGANNLVAAEDIVTSAAQQLAITPLRPIGQIQTAIGAVTVLRAGVIIAVKIDDPVYQEDVIETGSDGALGIIFNDGTTFNLSTNAHLVLDEFVCEQNGAANSALFRLAKGAFSFFAGKVAGTGSLTIDTPVAKIRSTARSGGMGIVTLATFVFSLIRETHAESEQPVWVDDGFISYKDLDHGTYEVTALDGLVYTVSDPGETLVLRLRGSSVIVDYIANSSAQMAQYQAAYQAAFATFSLGHDLGPQLNPALGSSIVPFDTGTSLIIPPPPPVATVTILGGDTGVHTLPTPPPSGEFINNAPTPTDDVGTVVEAGGVANAVPGIEVITGNVLSNDTDPDGNALFVSAIQAVTPAHGTFTISSDGSYTYTLHNTASGGFGGDAVDALAVGQSLTDTFQYTVQDSVGAPAFGILTITITGTNDAPTIAGTTFTDGVTELGSNVDTGTISTATQTFTFDDVDLTDAHSVSVTASSSNGPGGTAVGILSTLTISDVATGAGNGTVEWVYTVNAADVAYLAEGEMRVEEFTVTVTDINGFPLTALSDTATVSVTITGTNDQPDITGTAISADKTETDTTLTATGTLNVVDVDLSDTVTMTVDSVAVDGSSTFTGVNPLSNADLKAMMAVSPTTPLNADPSTGTNFDWTFTSGASGDGAFNFLADGETLVLTYTLKGMDDSGVVLNDSDTQVVTITITGTNDQPDITGTAISADKTETDTTLTATGTLNVVDVDLSDTVTMTVDSVAVDGSSTFTGVNPLSNADLKAMMAVSPTTPLNADPSTGTNFDWTFTSGASGDGAFNFLADGETLVLTYTLKGMDDSGVVLNDSDTQVVTITITGTNDQPDITGTAISADKTETDTTLTATGTLNVVDVDLSDTVTMTVDSVAVDGSSTFTGVNPLSNADLKAMMAVSPPTALNADPLAGTNFDWTFTSGASGDGAFNFLADGETLVLTYTLKGMDDSGVVLNDSDTQVVTITITGTNDQPDITGTAISADKTETDTTLTATGTLNVVDVDLSDTVTMTVDSVAVDGSSTFTGVNPLSNADLKAMMAVSPTTPLNADPSTGTNFDWTFTSGASGDGAFNFLADGETLVLTYTLKGMDDSGVVLNDSDTQVVTITITGTNDQPDITGTAISADKTETDTTLTATGTLNVVDVDLSDTVTMTVDSVAVDGSSTFTGVNPLSNADLKAMMAVSPTTPLNADPSTGTNFDWTFTSGASGDGAFNFLADGETLVLTYTLKGMDDSGVVLNDSDTQVVTITITGTNDAPTISDVADIGYTEALDASAQDLSASGTVSFDDIDTNDVVDISTALTTGAVWSGGTIDPGLKTLLEGGFTASVTDAAAPGSTPWSYTVNDANLDFLALGETITLTYTLTATDNNLATDTDTVTITITGTNDAPTISDVADIGYTEALDASAQDLSASGTVSFDDIDTNDVVDISTALTTGAVWSGGTIDPGLKTLLEGGFTASVTDAAAPGSTPWSYTVNDANLDFLALGETITLTYTLTATDNNLATDTDTVTITITGTNDAPLTTNDPNPYYAFANDAMSPNAISFNASSLFSGGSGSRNYTFTRVDPTVANWTWLTLNAAAGTVTGNPADPPDAQGSNGLYILKVDATDTITGETAFTYVAFSAIENAGTTINVTTNSGATGPSQTTNSGELVLVENGVTAQVNAAAGNDVVIGDGANNKLSGGNGRDAVYGLGGHDTLDGSGDADFIVGEAGDDEINGGGGNDVLLGGDGIDAINGDGDNDIILGGAGNDSLNGGGGNDTIYGGDGNDTIVGEGDADQLFGDEGNDTILGGGGDDILIGGDGTDIISGEGNNDIILGGAGNDSLNGGGGNDTFSFLSLLDGSDKITDFNAGTNATTVDKLELDVGASTISVGDNDTTVDNFRFGNNAAINVAGTEIGVKTDAMVTTAGIQTTIDGYSNITGGALFAFIDSTLGHAAVYYDANPSAAGGATLMTELTNITTLAGLTNFNAADFLFS